MFFFWETAPADQVCHCKKEGRKIITFIIMTAFNKVHKSSFIIFLSSKSIVRVWISTFGMMKKVGRRKNVVRHRIASFLFLSN